MRAPMLSCTLLSVLCLAGSARAEPREARTAVPSSSSCSAGSLAGSWNAESMTFDGAPRADGDLVGSRLTFGGSRLAIDSAKQGQLEFVVRIDADSRPCALHLAPVGASGEPSGWMLFAVDGDRLTLGFHDNLARRAASFEDRPDMVVLHLSRRVGAR